MHSNEKKANKTFDIRNLVLQYLNENGMSHSAFCFFHEAQININKYLAPSRLMNLVKKGMIIEKNEKKMNQTFSSTYNPKSGNLLPSDISNLSSNNYSSKEDLGFVKKDSSALNDYISSQVQFQLQKLKLSNTNNHQLNYTNQMYKEQNSSSKHSPNKMIYTNSNINDNNSDNKVFSNSKVVVNKSIDFASMVVNKINNFDTRNFNDLNNNINQNFSDNSKKLKKKKKKLSTKKISNLPLKSHKKFPSEHLTDLIKTPPRNFSNFNYQSLQSSKSKPKHTKAKSSYNISEIIKPSVNLKVPKLSIQINDKIQEELSEGFSFRGSEKEEALSKNFQIFSKDSNIESQEHEINFESKDNFYESKNKSLFNIKNSFKYDCFIEEENKIKKFSFNEKLTYKNYAMCFDKMQSKICILEINNKIEKIINKKFFNLSNNLICKSPKYTFNDYLVFYTENEIFIFDYK